MATSIVFDTCALIDLDNPQINLLNELLKLEKYDFKFLISETNFGEIHSMKIRHLIEKSVCFERKQCSGSRAEEIATDLEKMRINLCTNDRKVLILAILESADFICSSDISIIEKVDRYTKNRQITYMKPITTVVLFHMLYRYKIIDSSTFLEKSLALFKYKEIDNVLEHLTKKSPSRIQEEYIKTVNWYKEFMRERFQIYKDPLVNEYKGLGKKV